MKIAAVLLIILAALIAIVPQLTDCHSQGKMITLANGTQIDMKCHWTARAELALALPLAVVGLFMFFGSRRMARRELAILGGILGGLAALVPLALIGVCGNPAMLCNSVMQPALIFMGILAVALSVATLALRGRPPEQMA
jgi:hypothetical protein